MTDRELMQQALEALIGDRAFLESDAPVEIWGVNDKAIPALRERLAQPEQAPVAWLWRCKPHCGWPEWSVSLKRPADAGCDGNKRTEGYEDIPLYTFPPQRKPLTDEQIEREWQFLHDEEGNPPDHHDFARAIEAKLKEKNA
jgi:hypothetical protein